jgi:hypothetical protein
MPTSITEGVAGVLSNRRTVKPSNRQTVKPGLGISLAAMGLDRHRHRRCLNASSKLNSTKPTSTSHAIDLPLREKCTRGPPNTWDPNSVDLIDQPIYFHISIAWWQYSHISYRQTRVCLGIVSVLSHPADSIYLYKTNSTKHSNCISTTPHRPTLRLLQGPRVLG